MTLYTKLDCPLCSVVRLKLDNAGIKYDVSLDEKEMEALGIDMLPVLKTDENILLPFKKIIDYIGEVTKNEN